MIVRRRNRAAVARTIALAMKRRKARQEAAQPETCVDSLTNDKDVHQVKRDA